MSSICITGKPGAGKSLHAVYELLEVLELTTKSVVTNLPLDLDRIGKYFAERGRYDIDPHARIVILAWEDVKDFWRFRSTDFVAPVISQQEFKTGQRPDFTAFPNGGVVYFLDELHEHLNSRQWAETGSIVLYYIAKHRHLGDDVYWITQSPNNVDRQWRSVSQEYRLCRNWSKEMFKGFSKGAGFRVSSYLEPPTGQPGQVVQWERNYKLDKEKANCYSTSLAGKTADSEDKTHGLHFYWLLGGIMAIALGVMVFFWLFPSWWAKKALGVNVPEQLNTVQKLQTKEPELQTKEQTKEQTKDQTKDQTEQKDIFFGSVWAHGKNPLYFLKALPPGVRATYDRPSDSVILTAATQKQILQGLDFARQYFTKIPAQVSPADPLPFFVSGFSGNLLIHDGSKVQAGQIFDGSKIVSWDSKEVKTSDGISHPVLLGEPLAPPQTQAGGAAVAVKTLDNNNNVH